MVGASNEEDAQGSQGGAIPLEGDVDMSSEVSLAGEGEEDIPSQEEPRDRRPPPSPSSDPEISF